MGLLETGRANRTTSALSGNPVFRHNGDGPDSIIPMEPFHQHESDTSDRNLPFRDDFSKNFGAHAMKVGYSVAEARPFS